MTDTSPVAALAQSALAGRAAVVVGGSRGIGLAVVELLVDLGACVVVNGRDGTAVSEAVERMGGSATGFEGSPADPATADALIDCCVAEFGGIDILINCAGTAEPAGSSIKDVAGQIFIAAGGFVGRFDRATPGIVAYRDHHDSPPWSIDELAGLIVAR